MKAFVSVCLILLGFLCIHQVVYWVSPSVKVVNNSGNRIEQTVIKLPDSNLDFGPIENNQSNVIYYSLKQSDGQPFYSFTFSDTSEMNGSCRIYITSNQVNMRIIIYVTASEVVCEGDS